jgi:putative DNA primase/helicase
MAASPRVSFTQLPGIATNKDGGPRMGQPLKMTQLEKMVELLGVKARVNLMTKAVELSAPWGAGTNGVVEVIIEKLQTCGLTVPTRRVYDQLNEWAYCEMYHPIAEALPKWDGVDRFQALTDTIAAQNSELWQLYLRKWLLQAVRAWTSPGSQVGAVLVLAGEQNRGKSRWIKALHPRAMAGRHIDPHNKDTLLESLARPIVELGEIDSTFRKADIAALKAFLTNEEDTYRAPYAPAAKSWPRCTVFAATVNNTKFLVDETGNRRFWPVEVVAVQPDHSIDMMQVWAQAKALLDAGELWYLVGDELVLQMAHAEEHRLKSDVEDLFAIWWARVLKSPEPDRKKWPVFNLTTIMGLIGGHSTSQRDRATLARLCDQAFGKKLAVRGNRGWRVPVNKDAYDWNNTR